MSTALDDLIPDDRPPACPYCGSGATMALGTLGDLDHWRCRHCGDQFATNAEPFDNHLDPEEFEYLENEQ